MFPTFSQCTLLAALAKIAHANIMVESVDGTFVPWSLAARAPTGGIALRLTNYNDQGYLALVQMGTPPQNIQMAASLSQNDISVASPPQGSNDVTYYNPANSKSYLPINQSANITTFSGGTVTGRFAGEICSLQSATSALSFTYNASVVLTDPSVTNDLYPLGARGILGYGINAPANSPPNTSLIPTFLPANFTSAVCGIELNHIDDPVPDGIFTMGAVDQSAFSGDFTNVVVPQTSTISWSIPFDGLTYLVNGLAQSVAGSLVSVDIYHPGIQLTTDVAGQIYSTVTGSQAVSDTVWSIPCNSTFPLALTFGGVPFTMSERDTVVKLPNGTCNGVITGGAQGIGQIGAPFLRNVYTQFGAVKASNGSVTFSVGFATKVVRQVSNITPTSTIPKTTITSIAPTTSPGVPSSSASTKAGTSGAHRMISQNVGPFVTLVIASIVAILSS